MLWLVWRRASRHFGLVLPKRRELWEFPASSFQLVVVRGGVRIGGKRLVVHGHHRRQFPERFLVAARCHRHRRCCARRSARWLASLLVSWPLWNRRIQWILRIRCFREKCWVSLVLNGQEHVSVLAVGTNYSCLFLVGRLHRLLRTLSYCEVHHVALRWCVLPCFTARRVWRRRWLLPCQALQGTCETVNTLSLGNTHPLHFTEKCSYGLLYARGIQCCVVYRVIQLNGPPKLLRMFSPHSEGI